MTTNTRREAPTPAPRPRLTEGLPDIGGCIKERIEDFVVDEIPAYEPKGQGPHYYLRVEKRDVDGQSMVEAVADYFGVSGADVGTAGIKDRRAITRQWVSVPVHDAQRRPEAGRSIDDGIEIVEASRHQNKLRTGHLRGNRFRLVVRDAALSGDGLNAAVDEVATMITDEGLPNYYGLQRFGSRGSTLAAGWRWLVDGERPRSRFMQRMAASAFQSEVFNRLLARRLRDETWKEVVDGDIFEKTDTGGRFWIDASEREETQRRLDSQAIAVTGPMPGSKRGLATGKAGQMERNILAEMGVEEPDLDVFGRRGRGTRRPLVVYVDDVDWELVGDAAVRLSFALPAGSYATVLVREFTG